MSEQTETTAAKKPRLALLLATGFGLGYLPIAPGTWGSLGGVAFGLLFSRLWLWIAATLCAGRVSPPLSSDVSPTAMYFWPYVAGMAFFSAVGVWASKKGASHFQKSDPRPVVIDEISGQMITFVPVFRAAMIEGGWKYLLLGFILFRVFDIVKPPPARQAERWPHGWGIMADDWFAGLYAAAVLWVVRWAGWLG